VRGNDRHTTFHPIFIFMPDTDNLVHGCLLKGYCFHFAGIRNGSAFAAQTYHFSLSGQNKETLF
jgi:hypothetical protein